MPGTERQFRTKAIILKRRDFGEADRLITVLTPDHGKVDAIAKGARKPTSSKTGHVELFTQADMLISKGRELDIVVQVEMTEPYLAIREDLQRGAYANYAAELLDRFTETGDADMHGLFELMADTLQRLCKDDDPRLAIRYFEIRLLDKLGFRPELNQCVVSREDIQPVDQFYSNIGGGVVSPEYANYAEGIVPLPMLTLKLMRHMQRSDYRAVKTVGISRTLHDDVERVLLGYITFHLERRLQSVDFIRLIRH